MNSSLLLDIFYSGSWSMYPGRCGAGMLYYLGMVALGLFILWAGVRLADGAAASVYPGKSRSE